MNAPLSTFKLAPLFQAVGKALRQNQSVLNQADNINANHGDHMVEIFDIVAQAAQEKENFEIAEAMMYASILLQQNKQNASAQLYARGLAHIADQFKAYGITLDDLITYVGSALSDEKTPSPQDRDSKAGDVIKALMAGLVAWGKAENGQPASDRLLDMGTLLEFGMAYLQAKQRNSSRVEVLSDAAVSVSPLSRVPHRYQSGKLAFQALLQAMQQAQK